MRSPLEAPSASSISASRTSLHHRADHFVQPVRIRKQNVFDGRAGSLTFSLGHGGVLSRESGDVEHHQPAMTARSRRICRTFCALPREANNGRHEDRGKSGRPIRVSAEALAAVSSQTALYWLRKLLWRVVEQIRAFSRSPSAPALRQVKAIPASESR